MTAAKWVGYLEHKSPERLGYFTENVGKGYCTIFAAMLWESQRVNLMGLPWCATFVFAVHPARGKLGKPCPGVLTLARRMILRGRWRGRRYRPKRNDIIFCRNREGGGIEHCGIVESCDGISVTSIDGNSVDASGVFSPEQGGAVARRTRKMTDPHIVGYAAISEKDVI